MNQLSLSIGERLPRSQADDIKDHKSIKHYKLLVDTSSEKISKSSISDFLPVDGFGQPHPNLTGSVKIHLEFSSVESSILGCKERRLLLAAAFKI